MDLQRFSFSFAAIRISKYLIPVGKEITTQDVPWQPKWFASKKPASYWQELSHQFKFIHHFEKMFSISKPEDWMRISLSTVGRGGGWVCFPHSVVHIQRLLDVYGGSLLRVLETLYPQENWRAIASSRVSKDGKSSLLLQQYVNQISPHI